MVRTGVEVEELVLVLVLVLVSVLAVVPHNGPILDNGLHLRR